VVQLNPEGAAPLGGSPSGVKSAPGHGRCEPRELRGRVRPSEHSPAHRTLRASPEAREEPRKAVVAAKRVMGRGVGDRPPSSAGRHDGARHAGFVGGTAPAQELLSVRWKNAPWSTQRTSASRAAVRTSASLRPGRFAAPHCPEVVRSNGGGSSAPRGRLPCWRIGTGRCCQSPRFQPRPSSFCTRDETTRAPETYATERFSLDRPPSVLRPKETRDYFFLVQRHRRARGRRIQFRAPTPDRVEVASPSRAVAPELVVGPFSIL